MSELDWAVEITDAETVELLRTALRVFEDERYQSQPDDLFRSYIMVDRFASLRIEVFSNEHPPPHFRVKCNSETANYRISDCEQLNGGLERYYSVIRGWHAENKSRLIDEWNRRRPTDCPVGPYREGQ
jgi:type I restriction enzyme, R subunit